MLTDDCYLLHQCPYGEIRAKRTIMHNSLSLGKSQEADFAFPSYRVTKTNLCRFLAK